MALLYGVQNARRSRSTAMRALFLVVVIFVCYNSIQPSHGVFQRLHPTHVEHSAPGTPVRPIQESPIAGPKEILGNERPQKEQMAPVVENELARSVDENTQKPFSQSQPNPLSQVSVPNQKPISAIPPTGLQDGLRRMMSLLPDELRTTDLLRPIDGTGERKIHEIGLRARAFRTLYDAWEALHLIPREEGMYQRDDIIQYLQTHPDVGKNLQMDTTKIIHLYEDYRSLLMRLSSLLFPFTAPYFSSHMMLHGSFYSGRKGLVFSASDSQALYMITSIKSIRKLGCDLPIEVMYLGDTDLGEDFRETLEAIPGVMTRDLSQMVREEGWTLAGWAGKPFALLFSSFREAIFVDADALFMRNPAVLFEDPAYKAEGALFFKDRLMMPGSKKKWMQQILPKPISKKARELRLWTGESTHMQESGVVVVDKWKHFVSLLLVARLNGPDRDGNKEKKKTGVYDMVYGDKETFWLGWELAGDLGYAFHDGSAAVLGSSKKTEQDEPKDSKKDVGSKKDSDPKKDTNSKGDNNSKKDADSKKDGDPKKDASSKKNTDSKKEADSKKDAADANAGNFSICAPQLLHLDRDDRPLWFNGWLLPNKFSKEHNASPVELVEYIKEPSSVHAPGSWKLTKSNICCLRSDEVYALEEKEKEVLNMIIGTARELGAI
ncbi:hypothetical protein FE257_000891 [Aspergillus nanangensis]|uniref:Alpha-1,3-mannosyltransferase n=1 Tax=Aspergillus nanangensis TaxID=2582783 RepID=A0AAD4GPZ8_ASPNN|nr:hypothetical protein FE257_000891 [Aspergillus nanangensis]